MDNVILDIAIKVAGSFLAIYAFAVYIETPRKYVFRAGIVGAIGGFVYCLSMHCSKDIVVSSFLSALSVSFLSHTFARMFKTPVILFLVAGILPTVPGAGMYRIVHYILAENEQVAAYYFIQTLEIAGVIALAVFFADTVYAAFRKEKS